MAVSIADIKKLRAMTGAGLADVKKALTEADGDFPKAQELLRERGLAIAAKRSDRETSNGVVLVKKVPGFAAMVAVKCETDFVAAGKDFIAMVQEILDTIIEKRPKTLDEVKALTLASGDDAETAVKRRSGITGEKMELDGYNFIEATTCLSTTTWVSTLSLPWFSLTRRMRMLLTRWLCRLQQ